MLSSLRNMFRVPDLRNKILFTLLIIALYRFGAFVPVPGIDLDAVEELQAPGRAAAACSASCSSSPAARSPSSPSSRSGSCRTSRRRSSCRSSRVVIPKLEQWQQQGAVGQRKITQWTRYLAVAIALLQATGLAFLFHNGGGGLLGGGGNTTGLDLLPDVHAVPRGPRRAHPHRRAPPCSCGWASSSPSGASATACRC